jgi:hypothetical protein
MPLSLRMGLLFKVNNSGNHPKEIARLEKICGQSFAQSLIAATRERSDGAKMSWKWEKQLSRPKLVGFVSHPVIKDHPESELVQAVIRIHGQEVRTPDRIGNVDFDQR